MLAGIDLQVEPEQILGLIGRNGAGKTTLLRIAMGLIEPREGWVRVFGMDPRRDAVPVKRRIGYVSEESILPGFLRVSRVLSLHRRVFPAWDDALAAELLVALPPRRCPALRRAGSRVSRRLRVRSSLVSR